MRTGSQRSQRSHTSGISFPVESSGSCTVPSSSAEYAAMPHVFTSTKSPDFVTSGRARKSFQNAS